MDNHGQQTFLTISYFLVQPYTLWWLYLSSPSGRLLKWKLQRRTSMRTASSVEPWLWKASVRKFICWTERSLPCPRTSGGWIVFQSIIHSGALMWVPPFSDTDSFGDHNQSPTMVLVSTEWRGKIYTSGHVYRNYGVGCPSCTLQLRAWADK